MDLSKYIDQAIAMLILYGPKLILAIIVLVVGLWVIGRIVNGLDKMLKNRAFDPAVQSFLKSMASVLLKLMLIISVASMFGVETTSFVAVLGAMGLAIGLALQGSLGNFAGGILILTFKPYKVGDHISAQGEIGVVEEIQVFNTIMTGPGNRRIILPNGAVSNGTITNNTVNGKLRVAVPVGIGYAENIGKARDVILEAAIKSEFILQEDGVKVFVSELADSSVNLIVHTYSTQQNYWVAYYNVMELVKIALDEAQIQIPFPQRDVHMQHVN